MAYFHLKSHLLLLFNPTRPAIFSYLVEQVVSYGGGVLYAQDGAVPYVVSDLLEFELFLM